MQFSPCRLSVRRMGTKNKLASLGSSKNNYYLSLWHSLPSAAAVGVSPPKSGYVGERRHEGELVFYQVEPLAAVECKLLVAGKERKTLGDGMGNDDVVAGIAMVLLLVELEVGVCEGRIAA